MKVYNLDASALINGFYKEDCLNVMVSSAAAEIKDINAEMLMNNCINDGILKIESVDSREYPRLNDVLLDSGDYMRLSQTDRDVVALALKYESMGHDVVTISDDYSIQNVLKLLNLKFQGVYTKGISQTVTWQKICKGCRREYPGDTKLIECDVCGSPIIRKRRNSHRNY
ncbi:MAG: hypothetical protein BZ137_09115 [Methanosphaera sp. rholeuAM130]|nr:MAG: hypothetical protein BZ137_09115 [Methanosphaera sp. rholeuAM130]